MVLLWFYLIVPSLLQNVLGLSPNDIRLISAMIAFSLLKRPITLDYSCWYSKYFTRTSLCGVSFGNDKYANYAARECYHQAFKAMVPLLLTQGIVLFQDSSLVYVLSLTDFFHTATNIGERDGTQVEWYVCGSGVLYCQFWRFYVSELS